MKTKLACVLFLTVLGLTAPTHAGEVVFVRSGQVNGIPGGVGQTDSDVTVLANSVWGAPLSATPFVAADFAAADAGPSADIIQPDSAWGAQTLPPDPAARWIHPGSPNNDGRPANSGLYSIDFTITTLGATLARLDIAYSGDDTLGDWHDVNPANPERFFVNGVPIPATTVPMGFGGWRGETYFNVPVHTGVNTLYVYQRDYGGSVSGLIFSARISIDAEFLTESEPNSTKPTANPMTPFYENDCITGTTTGTGTANGDVSSADYFRVKTFARPLGIYRHELAITSATPGHTGHVRGLTQSSSGPGVAGTIAVGSDVEFQSSATSTIPSRMNAWYGFGREEEIYYAVTGTAATTSPYRACLTTVPVAPLAVPALFLPGTIVITTIGQGHSTDTEIHLFNSNLVRIDDANNDDAFLSSGWQTNLVRALAGGDYYLAIGNHNVATNDNSPADDNWPTANVLDFPDVIATSSTSTGSNVSFSISDGTTTFPMTASLPPGEAFSILFFHFSVAGGGGSGTRYCYGDGTGTACPCGNFGSFGNGCANSVVAAGALLSAGGFESVGSDSIILTGSGMPNSACLYFQGTTQVSVPFGDGLRCAGGTVIRLGTKTNVGGTSSYPEPGDPFVSVRGAVPFTGGMRTYQCWYRNAAAFCTPATYNLTNGLMLSWQP